MILAGGISPENVFDAIGRVRPAGIDSCMQTNARDALGRPIRFRKDRDRVRRLLDEVRRAEGRKFVQVRIMQRNCRQRSDRGFASGHG